MFKYTFLLFFLLYGFIFSQDVDSISFYEMKAHSGLFRISKAAYPGDTTIDVKFYKLNLTIDYPAKLLTGEVTVGFHAASAAINSLYLDLKYNMNVDSVKSEGIRLNYNHSGDILNINLARSNLSNEYSEVVVHYHGIPLQGNFGGFVFDNTPSAGAPTVWTLSEPYEAKNWWPCKDALTDKADSAEIWITSSPLFTSVSNGNLMEVLDNPNYTRTYKWKVSYPIAQYLISVAMAEYVLITDYFQYSPNDSMHVTHYIYPESDNPIVREQLSRTIPALQVFSELFGPYPWLDEKYGHAQCGFSGGMEHQTIASMGGFDENLILHELAHQWFGDKITCETWQDIWLNEGFATYSVALFREKAYGRQYYDSYLLNNMESAYSARGSIYVENITSLAEIFASNRSYAKGSVVLHMLRGVIGDTLFFKLLKEYALHPEFSYSTATTADFHSLAEKVSGMDLDYFFNQWIYGERFPDYKVTWGYQATEESAYTVNIKIDQIIKSNPQFFTMPVQIGIQTDKGDTTVVVFNNQQSQNFSIIVAGRPIDLRFDPKNYIMKKYSIITDSTVEPVVLSFQLSQNYPNPFNPTTKINFTIPGDGIHREFNVVMKLFDVLGNEIALLVKANFESGDHSYTFDPARYGLSSGVYFYTLNVSNPDNSLLYSNTRKMIYLR